MKRALILNTYFENGRPLYIAGQTYEEDRITQRMVRRGDAAVVEVGSQAELPQGEPLVVEDKTEPPEAAETQPMPAAEAPRRGRRKAT